MERGRPPVCPGCHGNRSVPKGYRVTKYQGVRRIRICKDCGHKFTPRNQTPLTDEEYRQLKQERSDRTA